MTDRRPLATTEEIADFLQVEPRTLETWAYRKTGPPYVKVGKLRRYRWPAVEAWVQKQTQATAGAA